MNAPARIAELERQLHWAQLEIQALREELRRRRIQQLGPKSETLSHLQLALLTEEEPSTTRDEVEAEARRERLTRAPEREHQSHPGRKPLPEDLPRVTSVIACQERTCASCGEETAVIGYDESEQLDVDPSRVGQSSRLHIAVSTDLLRAQAVSASRRFGISLRNAGLN